MLGKLTPDLGGSSFRQVPDNQEVFAHQATDQCVIVELLQYEDEVSDGQSARHFFDEIAGSNGCTPNDVAVLLTEPAADGRNGPTIDAPHSASLIVGDQRVAKFKESDDAKNVVRVYLGNIRCAEPHQNQPVESECGCLTDKLEAQTAGCDDRRGHLRVGTDAPEPGEQQLQRRLPARNERRRERRHLPSCVHVVRRARVVAVRVGLAHRYMHK